MFMYVLRPISSVICLTLAIPQYIFFKQAPKPASRKILSTTYSSSGFWWSSSNSFSDRSCSSVKPSSSRPDLSQWCLEFGANVVRRMEKMLSNKSRCICSVFPWHPQLCTGLFSWQQLFIALSCRHHGGGARYEVPFQINLVGILKSWDDSNVQVMVTFTSFWASLVFLVASS